MTGRVRGVLFDKDGTLFDFRATWAVWAGGLIEDEARGDAALAGRIAAALGYDLAARDFRPDSLVIAGTVGEIADALLTVLPPEPKGNLVARLDARAAAAPQVAATPLAPFLRGLAGRGLALGVATNDGERPARAHLEAAGVLGLFDFVAGADSGFGAKPGPGQLLAFAEAIEIAPGDCVMVGDSTHDLVAARAAGMRPVGVLTGYAGAGDLAPLAEVVLGSIAELPGWLGD